MLTVIMPYIHLVERNLHTHIIITVIQQNECLEIQFERFHRLLIN
jgi:hypothetical protein